MPLPGRVAAGLATLTVHRTLPGAPVPRPEGAACRHGRVPQMPGVVATEDTAPPSGWAVACACMGLVALEGSVCVGGCSRLLCRLRWVNAWGRREPFDLLLKG